MNSEITKKAHSAFIPIKEIKKNLGVIYSIEYTISAEDMVMDFTITFLSKLLLINVEKWVNNLSHQGWVTLWKVPIRTRVYKEDGRNHPFITMKTPRSTKYSKSPVKSKSDEYTPSTQLTIMSIHRKYSAIQ